MDTTNALSLIAIPLATSPLIYFIGRLATFRAQQLPEARRPSIARGVGLVVLAIAWALFGIVALDFDENGAATFTEGSIALQVDGVSLLFTLLALALATAVIISSGPYRRIGSLGEEKFYALLVVITGTMIGLVCTADLFNLWIWFETMVVSSYLMVAFYREQPAPLEAAVKYLVQSALGSVFVLLGIALVLAETGSVNMETVRTALEPSETLLVAGALFVAGFGIKSALVPFHTWLPDAYSQSPSGVSAILAGVVTSAGLVTLLRALSVLGEVSEAWGAILMGFGILNVVIGNLLAFQQQQIKRLLAYSSLPHIGFMLIGLGVSVETGIPDGAEGSLLHLFNHGLMKGAAFLAIGGIVYGLRRRARERGALTISQMAGLVHRYPVVVTVFSIAVLGLAGIPPLAGFVSLFRIFGAGMGTAVTAIHLVVILAAINELLALGYYLPVVNAVILGTPSETVMEGKPLSLSITAPLVLLGAAILGIGIYPEALEWLVEPAGQVITSAFGG